MKKNILFFTTMDQAPDSMEYKKWCFESWRYWANKHNVDIFILDTPLTDKNLMKPTWQRWYVFDILDSNNIEYDQVALVDADTLVHPDCPNFFEITGNKFCAVNDDLMVEWIHNSIRGYQDFWPSVKFDWTSYFNCGFIILNSTHKVLCKSITDFYSSNVEELRNRQHKTLKKGSDQTPVNYIVRATGTEINYLNRKFNFSHIHQRGVLNNIFSEVGYVYHFNGFEKTLRNSVMEQFWQLLKAKI